MTTPINTMEDIMQALDRNPELKRQLRQRTLDDEFIQLPAAVHALTQTTQILVERQDRMETLVVRMDQRQDHMEQLIIQMAGRQDRLENLIAQMAGRQDRLENLIAQMAERQEQADQRQDRSDERQDRLESLIARMDERQERADQRQDRLENLIARMDERQEQADQRQDRAEQRQDRMETTMARMDQTLAQQGGYLANLTGRDYETQARRQVPALIGRLNELTPTGTAERFDAIKRDELLADARAAGVIDWPEVGEIQNADFILEVQDQNGQTMFCIGEISVTVQQTDRDRAARRAAILQRATGVPAIPVTVGAGTNAPDQADIRFIECEYEPAH